jgi:hypothetical protein
MDHNLRRLLAEARDFILTYAETPEADELANEIDEVLYPSNRDPNNANYLVSADWGNGQVKLPPRLAPTNPYIEKDVINDTSN